MKHSTCFSNTCLVVALAVLAGCGKSESGSGAGNGPSQPAMPQTQGALATAADETKKAVSDAASTVAQNAKSTANDIASQFLTMAKAQKDNVLSSIGQDLGLK